MLNNKIICYNVSGDKKNGKKEQKKYIKKFNIFLTATSNNVMDNLKRSKYNTNIRYN